VKSKALRRSALKTNLIGAHGFSQKPAF